MTTHYEVLGVAPDASGAELRRAWLRAARRTHPDRGGRPEDFAAVAEAWSVLSAPGLRPRAGRRCDWTDAWGETVPFDQDPPLGGATASWDEPTPRPDHDTEERHDPTDRPQDRDDRHDRDDGHDGHDGADAGPASRFDPFGSGPRLLPPTPSAPVLHHEKDLVPGGRERAARAATVVLAASTALLLAVATRLTTARATEDLVAMVFVLAVFAGGGLWFRAQQVRGFRIGAVVVGAVAGTFAVFFTGLAVEMAATAPSPRSPATLVSVTTLLAAVGCTLAAAGWTEAATTRRRRRAGAERQHATRRARDEVRWRLAQDWNSVLAAELAPGSSLWQVEAVEGAGAVRLARLRHVRSGHAARINVSAAVRARAWVVVDAMSSAVVAAAHEDAPRAWKHVLEHGQVPDGARSTDQHRARGPAPAPSRSSWIA